MNQVPDEKDDSSHLVVSDDGELLNLPPVNEKAKRKLLPPKWYIRRTLLIVLLIGLPSLCLSAVCITAILTALGGVVLPFPGVVQSTEMAKSTCLSNLGKPKLAFDRVLPYDVQNPARQDRIFITDTKEKVICEVVTVTGFGGLGWRPGHNQIIFSALTDNNVGNYLVNPDGSGLEPLKSDINICFDLPIWSSDGSKFLVTKSRDGQVCSQDLYLIDVSDISENHAKFIAKGSSASWSNDGRHILYYGSSSNRGINLINADGTDVQLVMTQPLAHFRWSPDNQFIASILFSQGQASLVVTNVQTKEQRKVVDLADDKAEYSIVWAKDNQSLFVTINSSSQPHGIYSVSLDSKQKRLLTDKSVRPFQNFPLKISPDGNFLSFHDEQGTLWIMGSDGSNLHPFLGKPELPVMDYTWVGD